MHIISTINHKTVYITVAFLLVAGFLLLAMRQDKLENHDKPRQITVAVASAPITLDPRFATDAASARLLQLIAPPLVKFDDDFQLEYVVSDMVNHVNYKDFTVSLRELNFHDGEQLNANHIKSFYDSILNPATASPIRNSLKNLQNIEILNEKTLVFHLKKPDPWFFTALEIPIVKLTQDIAEKPVGLGEYRLESFDDYGNVVLERVLGKNSDGDTNEDTNRNITTSKRTLEFKVIKESTVRLLKALKGEVDIVHNDIGEELFNYGVKQGLQGVSSPSASYSYIGFNMTERATANLAVRKALSHAINREEMEKYLLGGRIKPAESLLLPSHQAFYKAKINEYNPRKAIEILEQVGFKADKNGQRLELTLSITTNPFVMRLAQAIQRDLAKIGVNLQISSSEWGTFYGNIKKGNFQAYILTWVGRFQPNIYENIFHSGKIPPLGANRGRYQNLQMDRLIEAMVSEIDDQKRRNLAKKIQQLQETDIIYIPLWRRNHVALVSPQIKNYQMPVDGGYSGIAGVLGSP